MLLQLVTFYIWQMIFSQNSLQIKFQTYTESDESQV